MSGASDRRYSLRAKPRYGIQGPDAVFAFGLLFLAGLLGILFYGKYQLIAYSLTGIGLVGELLMFVESSTKYRTSLRDRLIELAGIEGNEKVLDLGTGRGLLAVGFAKGGCETYGLDIWSGWDLWNNSLQKARENSDREGVHVKFLSGDAHNIPSKDEDFDLVVSSSMIHNIHTASKMRRALTEMKRVLKKDGRVILADNNPFFGPGWLKKRWEKELDMAGFRDISFSRFKLFTIIQAKNRNHGGIW